MKIAVLYSSDIQYGIIKGLEDQGHSIIPFYYGPNRKFLLLNLLYKFNKNLIKLSNVRLFNEKLIKLDRYYLQDPLDLILIIKGHKLNSRAERILKSTKLKKIQWTIDTVKRWPGQATIFPYMDKVFFQDGSDIQLHHNGAWLPLGFDDEIFKYNSHKIIDILFIGNVTLPFYGKRKECFLRLAYLAKLGYKISFAGSSADNELISVFNSNGVNIIGRQPLSKYAEIISQARICINIHQNDGGKAINPMFFAIPATGGLQLTDNYEYLTNWLIPYKHYYPTSPKTISDDILPLLSMNCLPLKLAEEVAEKHSYRARAKRILSNNNK